MVAGYRYDSKEMLAPFEYKGYTDQYLFSYWFEHMLCPTLKADDGRIPILWVIFCKSPHV